jgi:signal peptidase
MSTTATRRSLREQAPRADVPASAARPPRRRGLAKILADVLLWIAAIGGVVCITLVILAYTAGITLIMFKTGSMSPTIPAGSVAVVQKIPASEFAVGDVITIDRPGDLPVTHRVTSISAGTTTDERVITMKGDANEVEDPAPYSVSSGRIVLFSIPALATVIVGMGHPFVLGGITVAAATLVIWAFWPREKKGFA